MKKMDLFQIIKIVISCAGMSACSLGLITNVSGVFFTELANSLHVGQGAVSVGVTLTTITVGIASVFAVKIVNKYAIRPILILSTIITALSTLAMGYASNIWIYYILSILRGISSTFMNTPVITLIIGNWFISKRGVVSGLVMSFSGIAGALISPMLSKVIVNYGYQKAYIITSVLMILVSIPSIVYLENSPEKINYFPYVTEKINKNTDNHSYNLVYNKKSLLYVAICIIAFMCQSICSFAQHLSGYGQNAGLSIDKATILISMAMIGNIGGKFIVGLLSDAIGEIKSGIAILSTFTCGLIILYSLKANYIAMAIGALMLGFSYACAIMFSNIIFALYGKEKYGDAYSFLTIIINVASAVSVALIGYGYDLFNEYEPIILIFITMGIISIIGLLVIKKKVRIYEIQ